MLAPYRSSDLSLLQSWVTDKHLLFQFSATTFSYLITAQQIRNYFVQYPNRKFYIGLLDNNTPYAFGEIIPQESRSVRLGRILIGDKRLRGKGLGARFVRELLTEAHQTFQVSVVDLYVLANNEQAIRCYEKVGFTLAEEDAMILHHEDKAHSIHKMRITLH